MYDTVQFVQSQQDYLGMVASLSSIEAEMYSSAEVEVEPLFQEVRRAPKLSRFQIELPDICVHKRFKLNRPLELLLYEDEGAWVCEWDGILAAGCTPEEAVLSFCESFSAFWDEIAQQPDDRLTKSAQATKSLMLYVVKSVA